MNLILFDGPERDNLLPLVFHMPISELRLGIDTIYEKWKAYWPSDVSVQVPDYLAPKYLCLERPENIFVYGGVVPSSALVKALHRLELNQGLTKDGVLIAAKMTEGWTPNDVPDNLIAFAGDLHVVTKPWEVFKFNAEIIKEDYNRLTRGRSGLKPSLTNTIIGDQVFIEPGAKVQGAIINAEDGPVYIGKGAEVMEGSLIRGPFVLCHHATLKMGAKIYGGTTIGPHSKVGGEVNNSVIWGYSNKGHDGFLGNSVLGAWCNLGADTNNSNLKNNYGEVRVYSHAKKEYESTEMQFCGLLMGDHSKTGINTMLNTGTVVGSNANIFGGGFPPKFIPSFSWGGADGMVTFNLDKAKEVATRMMGRRSIKFTRFDEDIFEHIFEETSESRT